MKLLRLEADYPMAKLRQYVRNPNRGDVEAIKQALSRGQHRTIVVREATGEILAGNHVYAAALELGWRTINVSLVECTNEEAAIIVVQDNRISQLAVRDAGMVASLLERLIEAGRLAGSGYTADDYDDLLVGLGRIATTPLQVTEARYGESEEETRARSRTTAELGPGAAAMREVILVMTSERHGAFLGSLTRLRRAYGLDSTAATVLEAVERAAGEV